jgi:hypothetical protein
MWYWEIRTAWILLGENSAVLRLMDKPEIAMIGQESPMQDVRLFVLDCAIPWLSNLPMARG